MVIEDDWDLACSSIGAESEKLGKKVNFKEQYGKDLGEEWNTARKERAESLLKDKLGRITVQDLMLLLRDHFEGTSDYYDPPHFDKYYPPDSVRPRPICVDETQEYLIWQLKDGLPAEVGAKMWYGPSSTCTGVFVPVYAGSMAVPPAYSISEQRYSLDSAWWVFETIQRLVDKDYETLAPYIRATWQRFEEVQFMEMAKVEAEAKAAYARGEQDKGFFRN